MMKFKDLFLDMLDIDIPDDIAPYFKEQVKEALKEFNNLKEFIKELQDKINDKDR